MIYYHPRTKNSIWVQRHVRRLDIEAVMDTPGRGELGLFTAGGILSCVF